MSTGQEEVSRRSSTSDESKEEDFDSLPPPGSSLADSPNLLIPNDNPGGTVEVEDGLPTSAEGSPLQEADLEVEEKRPMLPMRKPQRKLPNSDFTELTWKQRKKHFFIFSWAGKPIYTRYGNPYKMSTFFPLLQMIYEHVNGRGDTLQYFETARHKFIFKVNGPLFFVCISRTRESVQELTEQMEFLNRGIVTYLTEKIISQIFDNKPQYDLRDLLSNTEVTLDGLIRNLSGNFTFYADGIPCLPLNAKLRLELGKILQRNRPSENILYTVLFSEYQLVQLVRTQRFPLHPHDLQILMNFIFHSKQSLMTSETWMPICLPIFNEKAFLHAHISYISDSLIILFLSRAFEGFNDVLEKKAVIVKEMKENNMFPEIEDAIRDNPVDIRDINATFPRIIHFYYKSQETNQCVFVKTPSPYNKNRKTAKRIFKLYQSVRSEMVLPHERSGKLLKFYFKTSKYESIACWLSPSFRLYACMDIFIKKHEAIKQGTSLMKWLKERESEYFIRASPVW